MSVRERVRAGRRSAAADTTVGRRRRRSDRRLVVVAIVGVIALVAAGGIAAVSTEHLVVPVPVTETILGSVACPSTDRCIAVGSIGSRYTIRVPFAVHSAGSWEVRSPAPPIDNGNSFLLSLSCAGDGRCVSVGSQEVPAPYFGAKSGGNRPLVETWNGRTWRPEKVPIPAGTADAELSGVDCVPSACMAVGTVSNRSGTGRVLTEWWNGSTWKLILPPRPRTMEDPSLAAVSCTSPASCTGVGQYTFDLGFGTLITPLILRWNGRQWRFQQSGRLGQAQDTMLNAVDCPTDTVCATVGSERTAAGTYRSIAEIRHGDTWRLTPTTDPPHTPDADLVAVDCTGPTACVAVGYSIAQGSPVPLVEWWDGSRWSLGSAPDVPGASGSALSGVACTAPDACVATGNFRHASPTEHAFTASWDGSHWTVTQAPEPAAS